MMTFDPGFLPVWFHFYDDHDDPLPFYSAIYTVAVVIIVFSKYLFFIKVHMFYI